MFLKIEHAFYAAMLVALTPTAIVCVESIVIHTASLISQRRGLELSRHCNYMHFLS